MVHIVRGSAAPDESALLQAMFIERKRVFVDLLHWEVPVVDGRYEIDQFDGAATVYLIVAGEQGEHFGSMRLLPSRGPNVLGDLFPGLCNAPPPEGPAIWEISRFCLAPHLGAARRRLIRDQLVSGAVQFALAEGIEAFTCVADLGWLNQIPDFGWRCQPLGSPQVLACGLTGAMRIDVTAETPSLMRNAGRWHPLDLRSAGKLAA